MELYEMIKNIRGKNNEDELVKAIYKVRDELCGLVEERMRKVYNSRLLKELNEQHIPARLLNTLDLGMSYEHIFILVPSNNYGYFLADLTFSQFGIVPNELKKLSIDGYQPINDLSLRIYLNVISKGRYDKQTSLENIYYPFEHIANDSNDFKK